MSDSPNLGTLFDPKGVVVVGASSHPGKFGFVALHNILDSGFEGPVYATNKETISLLGITTVKELHEIPNGEVDFAMICVPSHAVPQTLIEAAKIGVKAAFIVSGGYGEMGEDGEKAEIELVNLSKELGIAISGPNGQGFVSTPSKLCSQIVAPFPPEGKIAIASQSGNLLSSFMNLSRHYGIGISRGISIGNQSCLRASDYVNYFSEDPETKVIVLYLEGVPDGRNLFQAIKDATKTKPVVVIRGGSSPEGAKAAASHTGSLASDYRIFRGMLNQAGAFLADDPQTAYEWAASFATQPKPGGENTIILTTAGGWGVLTADAVAQSSLELADLEKDLTKQIDEILPPRWSRSNPIDIAGGETRETIPQMIDLILSHGSVDALIFLGLGIQGNVARLYSESKYFDSGMERIMNFHNSQEQKYATALIDGSKEWGKPVLVASELATSDPNNAGIEALRDRQWLCHMSGSRAVASLENLCAYARHIETG